MKRIVSASAAAAMMTALLPNSAQAWVQAGRLDCRSAGGATFVVGAVVQFRCMFYPAYGGRPHRYYATMKRLGVDLGFNSGVGLGWSVFAPTRYIGRGDLAGNYGGVQANASYRNRRRRQRSGRRLQQFLRAATVQRAGPVRLECVGRHCRTDAGSGALTRAANALTRSAKSA